MKRMVGMMAAVVLVLAAQAKAAETYKADPVHSSAVFRIKHANAAPFWGRFNEPAGGFVLDEADPGKSSFNVEIMVDKVSTGNGQRDNHLKSADFFNKAQYPKISFKSTSVKKGQEEGMLEVSGDLTMHGVTKPVTGTVEMTGKGKFMNQDRAGVEATFTVKMSDFEIKGMPGALSDEVKVIVALEGVKQ
jgi:polyisoprenoid-binding protein YceI